MDGSASAEAAAAAPAARRARPPDRAGVAHGLKMPALVRAMRPLQWTKNAVVFAALAFDRKVFEPRQLAASAAAALAFCCISSAVYLVNDVRDVAGDRLHPKKRLRPIASGAVTPTQATRLALILGIGALALSWVIRPPFAFVIIGYLALMTAYNYRLKRLVILDVFAIAAGFVLRAAGGAVAIDVPVSPWLYVCTMLLALFIGFGKRRHELISLEHAAGRHRANLDAYSVPLLDQLIGIIASATIMAYSIYTFIAPNVPTNHAMMLTIPFVVYAIFRYLYLVHRRDLGGSPEALLFADLPLFLCILSWGVVSVVILYLA